MEQSYKYSAFIAYSRADAKWAQWLQQKLERFRIPDKIQTPNMNSPKRLIPVFTDVSELSAGILANEIYNALEQSQYLISICSPNSANSLWVDKEVESFIKLGRINNIIPFIVAGKPFSDNPEDECFSQSLRCLRTEILGVNIKDLGKDAAVVKVVAYMIGVDFDTLWQHHKHASLINVFKIPFSYLIQSVKNLIDYSDIYELDSYQPKNDGTNIFISYRRKDGQSDARAIELALGKFGYKNVFFDYKSVREGKFNIKIIDAIYSCKDFILVLSPKSMKKCHKRRDWVAREIRTALKFQCNIIPVVIENSFRGWPMSFPKDLDVIKSIQQQQIRRDEFFEHSIEELTERLKTSVGFNNVTKKESKSKMENLESMINELNKSVKKLSNDVINNDACYKVRINIPCKMIIDDKKSYDIVPNKLFVIQLKRGIYLIKILSDKNEDVLKEQYIRLEQDVVSDLYFDGSNIIDNSVCK